MIEQAKSHAPFGYPTPIPVTSRDSKIIPVISLVYIDLLQELPIAEGSATLSDIFDVSPIHGRERTLVASEGCSAEWRILQYENAARGDMKIRVLHALHFFRTADRSLKYLFFEENTWGIMDAVRARYIGVPQTNGLVVGWRMDVHGTETFSPT